MQVLYSNYKIKSELIATQHTVIYSSNNNKKQKDGKISSPINYTIKTNGSVNNAQNENYYKNINDWVYYINSDNAIPKKNKKKKNTSIRKKINKRSIPKIDINMVNSKIIINEFEIEIEEFKNKIIKQSIQANLTKKIKPHFSEKWLKFIQSTADN